MTDELVSEPSVVCPHPLCGLPPGSCATNGGRTERFLDCPCPEPSVVGMVERVERAIADALGFDLATLYANKSEWIADRGSRHDINVPYRGDITDAARAAIAAMREPTEGMLGAASDAEGVWETGSMVERHRIRHRAMIDSALAEDTSDRSS